MGKHHLTPVALEELPPHSNLLQSGYWGAVKCWAGQQVRGFLVQERDVPLVVYFRKFGPGMTLAYIPHGPWISIQDKIETPPEEPGTYLAELTEELRPHLPKNCVFIRYDLPWRMADDYVGFLGIHPPFVKAGVDIQPPSTVVLDISVPEEEILSRMKSKTRYNIRLADKKGVEIRAGKGEDLASWYDMYMETAERDKITIHSKEYYETLFQVAESFSGDKPEIRLFMAGIDGKDAAGIITAAWGKRATYLYGASNNYKRNCMPAYGLQWESIKWARSLGCEEYDFFGIPPTNDPEHPMHGLFRFKTGFGGEIIHRFGCWDFPVKPGLYKVSGAGEKLRNFYYKKIRKR